MLLLALLVCGLPGCSGEEAAQEPDAGEKGRHIRLAEPLTPEGEQKTFVLPPGFRVELFAAEPDISKPMNYEDTHGMVNHLTRGYDGWIYAAHGFTNRSEVTDASGHAVTMVSGIGFAPPMMDHDHGPTAISGLVLYQAQQFPPAYRHSFLQGNVVDGRILRDSLTWRGASPEAVHKGDFMTSSDPWFRPSDMAVGPDGALYVADFYNRIIGHYHGEQEGRVRL